MDWKRKKSERTRKKSRSKWIGKRKKVGNELEKRQTPNGLEKGLEKGQSFM